MTNSKYDLEERTAKFGENTLKFVKKIPLNTISEPLIKQLIRSATSVGANYCEADDAESKKDFKHKISISKKEARETKHWFRMISNILDNEDIKQEARNLWQEAKELNLIFNAIIKKTKN